MTCKNIDNDDSYVGPLYYEGHEGQDGQSLDHVVTTVETVGWMRNTFTKLIITQRARDYVKGTAEALLMM